MVFFKKHFENPCNSNKKRDRKATETAILMAASRLFAEKGYENTRTLEIAKEAGANEALIGRYFGGKEGLLTAVLKDQDALQNVINKDEESNRLDLFPSADEVKTLKEAIQIYFENGRKSVELKEKFMRIGCSRSLIDPEMAAVLKKEVIERRLPLFLKQLETFPEVKNLKKADRESLAFTLLFSNFQLNFMARKVHEMGDERVDNALEFLTRALSQF